MEPRKPLPPRREVRPIALMALLLLFTFAMGLGGLGVALWTVAMEAP